MNDLTTLYKELGEHICLYPFFGAFYQTNNVVQPGQEGRLNSVRPCSIVSANDMTKWDIRSNSIRNARNGPAWKEMRQRFLDGEFYSIADCRDCSFNEKSGTTSPRQMNNKFYTEFLSFDIVDEVRKIVSNDNRVDDIIALDYYPSNYCNYQCVMCAGGASSQRLTYEIKILNRRGKIELNSPDPDFYQVLDRVEIINFTGGETVLQKQVHDIMDYLIDRGMARKILITLLTNASSSPEPLIEKFRHFKKVIYNVSVDGTGDVIEYQRRGCSWPTVEKNALELMHHDVIVCVLNYVLTSINVLSFDKFIEWAWNNQLGPKHEHDYCQYITISPVFRENYLGVSALPMELRQLALDRLYQSRTKYANKNNVYDDSFAKVIDRVISVINSNPHNPEDTTKFIRHIQNENLASRHAMHEVVPEWAPWFS